MTFIPSEHNRIILASIDGFPTPEDARSLSQNLDLLTADADPTFAFPGFHFANIEPPILLAVRQRTDGTAGLEITLSWLIEPPSQELIEEYRAKVSAAMTALPR